MISSKDIQENFVPVCLEFLSPVHIGSGEMLSPLEYQAVEEQSGQYTVYTIDYEGWLNSLTPDEAIQIAAEFSRSNQNQIWQFLRGKIDKNIFIKTKSKASKTIYDKYISRLTKTEQSKNELAPATRNSLTSAMIVPGSSIKGAIRTAIIDFFDNGALLQEYKRGKDNWEKNKFYTSKLEKMFGKISENAFKQLKVSDFELLLDESEFVQSVEKRAKDDSEDEKKPICEVAPTSAKPKYGKMYLGNFADNKEKAPLTDWSFEGLRKVCNAYYLKRFEDEYNKFYTLPQFSATRRFIDSIRNKLHNENAILLRVGHFSHVECVTVENSAPVTPFIQGTKKHRPYGTTRTLANGVQPFGWVLLHKCSYEEYEQGLKQEQQAKQEYLQQLQERKELFVQAKKSEYEEKQRDLLEKRRQAEEKERQEKEEKLRLEQEQAQKEAEKQARKQAEQAKKEAEEQRLAALSPQDRLVELVLLKKAAKEDVLKVYERIDSLENQYQVAEAIKAFWQKEKAWSGKLKPNQKERVDKITAILRKK